MVEANKLRFGKGDWLAMGLVVLLAVLVGICYLPRKASQAPQAQIYLNGQLIKTVALNEDQVFTVSGSHTNEITVAGGKISVTRSDCPGGDCMHSGSIGSAGRVIVCLPNALEIRIVSGNTDVDFVVG